MKAVLAVLIGCAHSPPQVPAAPSNAQITDKSHAVLDAFDRGDATTWSAMTSTEFVRFEGDEPVEKAKDLERMAKRTAGAPHIATRTWSHEHVYVTPDRAVFIGEAVEHDAGNDSHGGFEYDGWYTLAWHRDGSEWKLGLWTWRKGGKGAERDAWNDTFRQERGFTKEPNRLLVEAIRGVKPGTALDVAMGQGRNALYLVSQGWKTTGVDFSAEGLRKAQEAATARHLELEVVSADIDQYDFGIAKWDLVTMIYAGTEEKWIKRIQASLKPGGLYIAEYFHNDQNKMNGFATGQLAKLFADGYDILRDDVVEDHPDWALDKAKLVRFVARKR
jgi:SAM-dependent methyltransferase